MVLSGNVSVYMSSEVCLCGHGDPLKCLLFVGGKVMLNDVPMIAASRDAELVQFLAAVLPAPPKELLLLENRTSELAAGMAAIGFDVTTHTLTQPHAFAQQPNAARQGIWQVDLDLDRAADATFEVALVTDFSAQVHPLALFDQLARWMSQDATVILVGRQPQEPPPRVTRWLEYVEAIGTRCGFATWELPIASTPAGSFARAFRKSGTPRWQLRHMRPGDFAEIAELFQVVFEHPMSREMWEWKYANGHGNAVLASRDGVLVAHYGGMYRDILLCGQPEWAYGGCDVMVHPQERGVMTRQGPFLLTAATTAEIYGPVAFGFPTERAMLVAERMGLYVKAGQMAEIRWEPAATGFRLRTRVRALNRSDPQDAAVVEKLWTAMAHDLRQSVVGVRNWKYLEDRYFGHPHNQYEVLAVTSRLTGQALGVMVLRRLEDSCELLDVIAPLANLALVIDQARRMTARGKLAHLYCWITTNFAPLLVACGGTEKALNVFIPTSCWTDDPRVDMLKDKWWLMSGDTDFR